MLAVCKALANRKRLDLKRSFPPWGTARVGGEPANQMTLNVISRVVLISPPVEWIVDLLEVITNAHDGGDATGRETQPL